MKVCKECGQVVPDPTAIRHITDAELDALSAWWWSRTIRGAARVLGRAEQTIKNQLYDARRHSQCRTTLELAQTFMNQLRTMEQLTSHNRGRRAA
jgi:hypothetical protein